MTPPEDRPAGSPQVPLSEAVEQAGGTARRWVGDLQRFGEEEAELLVAGRYGLSELATAPVRLYAVLLTNLIRAVRTASDNLALLSLSGRFGSAEARRVVRVHLDPAAAPGAALVVSDLTGQLTGYCIPRGRVRLDTSTVPADRIVTVTVDCVGAPSDAYLGTLVGDTGSPDPVPTAFLVAVDEIGIPVT